MCMTAKELFLHNTHFRYHISLSGEFTKLRKAIISFVMSFRPSVCPHGITRLPQDGFSLNLTLQHFSKICPENSSFIKIGEE